MASVVFSPLKDAMLGHVERQKGPSSVVSLAVHSTYCSHSSAFPHGALWEQATGGSVY